MSGSYWTYCLIRASPKLQPARGPKIPATAQLTLPKNLGLDPENLKKLLLHNVMVVFIQSRFSQYRLCVCLGMFYVTGRQCGESRSLNQSLAWPGNCSLLSTMLLNRRWAWWVKNHNRQQRLTNKSSWRFLTNKLVYVNVLHTNCIVLNMLAKTNVFFYSSTIMDLWY